MFLDCLVLKASFITMGSVSQFGSGKFGLNLYGRDRSTSALGLVVKKIFC